MRAAIFVLGGLIVLTAIVVAKPSSRASAVEGDIVGLVPNAGGFAIVVWGGGTPELMQTSALRSGCGLVSVWVTQPGGGDFVGLIFGAPAFVNAAFRAIHPGSVGANTPVLLVCRPATPTAVTPATPTPPPVAATPPPASTPAPAGTPPPGAPTYAVSGDISPRTNTQFRVAFLYDTSGPTGQVRPPVTFGRICRNDPTNPGLCTTTAGAPLANQSLGTPSGFYVLDLPPPNSDWTIYLQLCNEVGCAAAVRAGAISRHEGSGTAFYSASTLLPGAVRAYVFNMMPSPFASSTVAVAYGGVAAWSSTCVSQGTCGGVQTTTTSATTATVTQTHILAAGTSTGARTVTIR